MGARAGAARRRAGRAGAAGGASGGRGAPALPGGLRRALERGEDGGGAGAGTSLAALAAAEARWAALRAPGGGAPPARPDFLRRLPRPAGAAEMEVDVAVAGGTLGVFFACALQQRGWRVALVERGRVEGRGQEWNISRRELAEVVGTGVLSAQEVEAAVRSDFNPVRAGFHRSNPGGGGGVGDGHVEVQDILNVGVSPESLVASARGRFERAGGTVLEGFALAGVDACDDGVLLRRAEGGGGLRARLCVDCMGNSSPIVAQLRRGQRPDGVCLVVGSLARGFDPACNETGDLIWTDADARPGEFRQDFWEAFPAGGAGSSKRTTYLFSYLDAAPERPSLETLLRDYWERLGTYQGIPCPDEALDVERVLFGVFPTYKASPLAPGADRVIQVGDASGLQSPLSFGGFGALSRHLPRLVGALNEALETDQLDQASLSAIAAYLPSLSVAWLFQRAMSIRVGARTRPDFINQLLGQNFAALESLGPWALRPFLQDVVQFGPLGLALGKMMLDDPAFTLTILRELGPGPILEWSGHFLALGLYAGLHRTASPALAKLAPALPPAQRFHLNRLREAWEFGSGSDYRL